MAPRQQSGEWLSEEAMKKDKNLSEKRIIAIKKQCYTQGLFKFDQYEVRICFVFSARRLCFHCPQEGLMLYGVILKDEFINTRMATYSCAAYVLL